MSKDRDELELNKAFIMKIDAIYSKAFKSDAERFFPLYSKKRKTIMNSIMSGDVSDALFKILTCEGN